MLVPIVLLHHAMHVLASHAGISMKVKNEMKGKLWSRDGISDIGY